MEYRKEAGQANHHLLADSCTLPERTLLTSGTCPGTGHISQHLLTLLPPLQDAH